MSSAGYLMPRCQVQYSNRALGEPVQPMSHPNIKTIQSSEPSTRHNSTIMNPIQKAIEDIKSREDGASFSYREVAKK
jgi:hypothetical protein